MNKEPVYIYLIPKESTDLIEELRTKLKKAPTGKPYLEDPALGHISISHSGKYFVAAMGDLNLGVDLQEYIIDKHDYEKIMNRFFHYSEREYVMNGRDEDFFARFFKIWTAKESYVKYTGTGITDDFSKFSVLKLKDKLRFVYPDVEEGYALCVCMKEPREIRLKFLG